ncbi:TPA: hypothetical protein QDB35_000139 [Burkholderia vietnamiensis]|nr:hypothetical protein [Burkholderia vietnamiensis]
MRCWGCGVPQPCHGPFKPGAHAPHEHRALRARAIGKKLRVFSNFLRDDLAMGRAAPMSPIRDTIALTIHQETTDV